MCTLCSHTPCPATLPAICPGLLSWSLCTGSKEHSVPAAGQAVSTQHSVSGCHQSQGIRRHCLGTALLNTVRKSLTPCRSEDNIFPGFSQQAQTSQHSMLSPAPVFVQVVQSCMCMSTALCTNPVHSAHACEYPPAWQLCPLLAQSSPARWKEKFFLSTHASRPMAVRQY